MDSGSNRIDAGMHSAPTIGLELGDGGTVSDGTAVDAAEAEGVLVPEPPKRMRPIKARLASPSAKTTSCPVRVAMIGCSSRTRHTTGTRRTHGVPRLSKRSADGGVRVRAAASPVSVGDDDAHACAELGLRQLAALPEEVRPCLDLPG